MKNKQFNLQDFICSIDWIRSPRTLNVGAKDTRFGLNCYNLDLVCQPGIDIVCGVEDLNYTHGEFNIIICNAVLQYCDDPGLAVRCMLDRLAPYGQLFIDVPFVQGGCPDTASGGCDKVSVNHDKHRFSLSGLKSLIPKNEYAYIKYEGYSQTPGQALRFMCIKIAEDLTRCKYVNHPITWLTKLLTWPLQFITTAEPLKNAGSVCVVIARRY